MNACVLMTDEELDRLGREPSGFGNLETARGRLPLTALSVRARIVALIAQTELEQTFKNTLAEPIEATYIFPLPDRAAVTSFQMQVGARCIDGVIDERGRARVNYETAIAAGYTAAIAEEDRPGVFTLRVGNLMPGETAVVRLTLVGPLPFEDGEASFVFPLVVAPRYIPGVGLPGPQAGSGTTQDTDAVPDASRITPPLLLPGFPNPVQLRIDVELDGGGVPLTQLRSSLHAVTTTSDGAGYEVSVQPGERLNRDFILRWRLGDAQVRATAVLVPDAEGQGATCLVTVVPPREEGSTKPRDVVFVLDRSGSMQGWKMVAARRAVARMIDTLGTHDRFAVLAFDDHIEMPDTLPQGSLTPATDRHRFRAVEFLASVESRGGTELLQPLQAAAKLLAAEAARDRVLILVTDGQVGNEDQILRALASDLQHVRIFTLGIDRAVNAAFLRRLAGVGGGACELVESEDRLDEVMSKVHRRIGQPVVTRLQLQGEGVVLQPDSLAPARLPDLFAGAPLALAIRVARGASGSIVIQGQTPSGRPWTQSVPLLLKRENPAAAVWARARIRDLEDRYVIGDGDNAALERQIVAISLEHRVLSRFTAFLAVDRSSKVNPGGNPLQLTQAVESPEGWGAVVECAAAPVELGFMADGFAPVLESGHKQMAEQPRGMPAPPAATPLASQSPFQHPAAGAAPPQRSMMARLRAAPELTEEKMKKEVEGVDLGPYLQRVRELADAVEHAGRNADQDALDRLLARLIELIEDVRSVSQAGGLPEQLERVGVALQALLGRKSWQSELREIAEESRRVAEQLREITQHVAPSTPPAVERSFWK